MKTFEEWKESLPPTGGLGMASRGDVQAAWNACAADRDAEIVDKDLTITRLKDILGEHAASGEETSEDAYQNYLKWITKFHEMKTQVADKDRTIARVRALVEEWRWINGGAHFSYELLAALEGKQ